MSKHQDVAQREAIFKGMLSDAKRKIQAIEDPKGWVVNTSLDKTTLLGSADARSFLEFSDIHNTAINNISRTSINGADVEKSVLNINGCHLINCYVRNGINIPSGNLIVHNCTLLNTGINAVGLVMGQRLGKAVIKGRVLITEARDVLVLGPSPSSGRSITAHIDLDLGIRINTGCFSGTLEHYKCALELTHKDTPTFLAYHTHAYALIQAWVENRKLRGAVVEPQPDVTLEI